MHHKEIARLRTAGQLLNAHRLASPPDVVSWFGALQAQDYAASKWAVASRSTDATDNTIEALITQKRLVRCWPMRGTIHMVLAEDAHWMIRLMATRVQSKLDRTHRELGLDDQHFTKAAAVLASHMPGNQLTRPQVRDVLMQAGLDVGGQRLYHTIVQLAHQGQLAITGLNGKQPTFVWFDDWLPAGQRRNLDGDAALAEIAWRYIRSHGPVTVYDFAWWTGLTIVDARRAFALVRDRVVAVPDTDYWMSADVPAPATIGDSLLLAPSFDETILGFKDRSAVVTPEDFAKLTPYANGIFKAAIVMNGQFAGLWHKKVTTKGVAITYEPTKPLNPQALELLSLQAQNYAAFLERPLLSLKSE
jgi:hypothetical protein